MSDIKGNGYTFNTETRELTFVSRPCKSHGCTDGKVKNYPSCPHYGKVVNKFQNRRCPVCGCKNKNSHGRLPDADGNPTVVMVDCYTCKGTGTETPNHYTTLDFHIIAEHFKWEIFKGRQTFNDAYLGIGNVGGIQGYTEGKYSTVEQCKAEFEAGSMGGFNSQAGNFVSEDGKISDAIYFKTYGNGCGFTAMIEGAKFGR